MNRLLPVCCLLLFAVPSIAQAEKMVRFDTSLGSFDIRLFDVTPLNRDNFLSFVNGTTTNGGSFDNTVVHRAPGGFVVQGGSFIENGPDFSVPAAAPGQPGGWDLVPTDDPVQGEPADTVGLSNTRGTIALALSSGPDSGTSGWFINLGDNSFLDDQFTVFGEVVGSGMDIVDAIAALPKVNRSAAWGSTVFADIPVQSSGDVVLLNSASEIPAVPEPEAIALGSLGFLFLLAFYRCRQSTAAAGDCSSK